MSEKQTDHARGCQGREYTCTCGYDEQREWQPIETAPKDGTVVDLWHKDGFRITDEFWLGDEEECWTCLFSDEEITHWMHPPSPPKPLPTPSIQVAE